MLSVSNFGYNLFNPIKTLDWRCYLHTVWYRERDFRNMKLVSTSTAVYNRHFSTTRFSTAFTKWKYKKSIVDSPKIPNSSTRLKWSEEQLKVLDAVSDGKSVFVTGSAGTGKTALLEAAIRRLKKLHGSSKVFVTASTGISACALDGQTLHSFAGIGVGGGDRGILLEKVLSNKMAYWRWNRARALVIDEISMISAELFDNIEYIAKHVRSTENELWGGIQLIVSGDFFQLPPILDKTKSSEKMYAFEADCWGSSFDFQIELTKTFRQSEAELVELLQNIRKGKNDPKELQLLEKCSRESEPDSSVVQLYPLCRDVNRVNQNQLEKLNVYIRIYRALDSGLNESYKRQLTRGITSDELALAQGARVVLCKNLNPRQKLVNGATGTVVSFYNPNNKTISKICKDGLLPVVEFDSGPRIEIYPVTWKVVDGGKVVATRKQLPLILAWALSVHKCQGMTLNKLHTDLSRAFGFGMVYVALSRVRNLDGLHLSDFNPSKIRAHPKVLEFYQNFLSK